MLWFRRCHRHQRRMMDTFLTVNQKSFMPSNYFVTRARREDKNREPRQNLNRAHNLSEVNSSYPKTKAISLFYG